ncbi:MAG: hypothetical protein EPO27_11100 [Betaproteobacteria bacterium]|nr:MAG: hypothetical protein EPO27_11100 [Betaproteobacteria bacterium]
MRKALMTLVAAAMLAANPVLAADVRIVGGDTFESVLMGQINKRVTVRLRSGQEMTGTVRAVTARLVHLGAISGREFFDAVIAADAIEAVVIRTRD